MQDLTAHTTFSIVGTYQFTPKWNVSALFIYNTGNAVTYPTGKYELNGNTIYQYSSRNADRMPDNHRLDLNFTKDFNVKEGRESSLSFGCYNVYGRENAYTITFRENEIDPNKIETVQNLSLSLGTEYHLQFQILISQILVHKMKNLFYIIAAAIIFIFTSCEKVIELDLQDNAAKLVIEGNITDGEAPYYVTLTQSLTLSETGAYPILTMLP